MIECVWDDGAMITTDTSLAYAPRAAQLTQFVQFRNPGGDSAFQSIETEPQNL